MEKYEAKLNTIKTKIKKKGNGERKGFIYLSFFSTELGNVKNQNDAMFTFVTFAPDSVGSIQYGWLDEQEDGRIKERMNK